MKRSRTILAAPPGYTIKEQLSDRKMTQKEFALRMDMSEKHISRLINGDVRLTPDVAIRLEAVLGVPARYWSNLEAIYMEKLQQAEEENAMDTDIEIMKQMPYVEMAKLGWLSLKRRAEDKVRELRRYFGVARLEVIEHLKMPGIAYRRLGKNAKSDYVLAAWSQKAKLLAQEIEVQPINLQRLSSNIAEIRGLTVKPPEYFIPQLNKYYGECGIAVVYLRHLEGSFLQGASFVDGKKIVIGLTLRGTDADKFWFSLFHETGHILAGHINKPYGSDAEDEEYANNFAMNVLIPPDKYEAFVSLKDFSPKSVKDFANEVGIDAGIVVGRLQKEGEVEFNQLNGLKTHYKFS